MYIIILISHHRKEAEGVLLLGLGLLIGTIRYSPCFMYLPLHLFYPFRAMTGVFIYSIYYLSHNSPPGQSTVLLMSFFAHVLKAPCLFGEYSPFPLRKPRSRARFPQSEQTIYGICLELVLSGELIHETTSFYGAGICCDNAGFHTTSVVQNLGLTQTTPNRAAIVCYMVMKNQKSQCVTRDMRYWTDIKKYVYRLDFSILIPYSTLHSDVESGINTEDFDR